MFEALNIQSLYTFRPPCVSKILISEAPPRVALRLLGSVTSWSPLPALPPTRLRQPNPRPCYVCDSLLQTIAITTELPWIIANMHTAQRLGCRRWNRLSTPTSTPNVDDSLEGEQESWRELLRKLEEVQLNLEDLPTREELLWGMLQELCITS